MRTRSFWLSALAVAYVCIAAAQASGRAHGWLAAVLLPLGLAEVWRRTGVPRTGEDRLEPGARAALRTIAWGIAIWTASRLGPPGRPAFDAAANTGTAAVAIAALVSLARIHSPGGLLTPPPAARSLDAAAFAGFVWAIASALPATRALLPTQFVDLDPLAIDYATVSASLATLALFGAATWRLRVLRRLEMGVGDRAAGALALSLTATTVSVPAAYFEVAAPDRILPVAVIACAVACAWAATTPEPTTVSSALRGVLAIMMLGAPTTLAAGLIARAAPGHAGAVVLSACAVSITVGLIARAVSRPLGPEQSRWLDAIDAASRGALQPEPDAAIRAVLIELSGAATTAGRRAELWRSDPPEVLHADLAGYLHAEAAGAPDRLYELALREPERTLRVDALRALQVRQPVVRPLLSWFEARQAFCATAIVDEDGPLGFLLLPRGRRRRPMTLEEARPVRLLTDRLSALLAVSSALARSRHREQLTARRADELDEERERLEHIITLDSGRNQALAERLAHPLKTTAFSPAARLALTEVERLSKMHSTLVLQAPPGSRVLSWAAVAHLASARSGGPLVCVNGSSSPEHNEARWTNKDRSPLELADGGSLFIRDVAGLPLRIQQVIAQHLAMGAQRPPRSTVIRAGLIVSTHCPLDQLTDSDRLEPSLARWLNAALVKLPALSERGEDLRTIILDALARAGMEASGRPLGLDAGALRALIDHPWPGNELELRAVVARAAHSAQGPQLTLADLDASGFAACADSPPNATPLAPAVQRARRRPRPRRG